MCPPVEECAARDTVLIAVLQCFRDHHDAVRVGIRQRPQQRRVEHAVDRGIGADAEREHQGGDGRESGAACQQPQTEPGILPELGCELPQAPALFDAIVELGDRRRARFEASEFGERLASSVFSWMTFLHQILCAHVDVEADFIVHVEAHVGRGAIGTDGRSS